MPSPCRESRGWPVSTRPHPPAPHYLTLLHQPSLRTQPPMPSTDKKSVTHSTSNTCRHRMTGALGPDQAPTRDPLCPSTVMPGLCTAGDTNGKSTSSLHVGGVTGATMTSSKARTVPARVSAGLGAQGPGELLSQHDNIFIDKIA